MRCDLLAEERRTRRLHRLGTVVGSLVVVAAAGGAAQLVLSGPQRGPIADAEPVALAKANSPAATRAPTNPKTNAAGNQPPPLPAAPVGALRTKPLSVWLGEVARDARRDLVLAPELRGDLTASETTELDWETRLDAYARVFGFSYELSKGLIEVWRESGGTHVGPADDARDANAPDQSQASANNLAAQAPPVEPPPPLPETRVVRLVHAPAKETAAVLDKAAHALDVTATPDLSTNSVVLSGSPSSLARVQKVIGELDRPRRRILLEAKIVEVVRSARLDLGVEWKLTGTTVGGDVRLPPNHGEGGSAALLLATGGSSALDARISALEASGKLRVVSRPSVVMTEGSPATIESVRILRIRLPSQGSVVGGEVAESSSNGRATEDIPVGVRLEVTPAIRGGSRVLLRIRAKSSSLGAPLPPDDIPEELSRMVDAEVMVANEETAVLGGLSRQVGTNGGAGVPGLRKIPGLGLLFGKRSNVDEDEELLVLVTPRLLD